LTRKPLSEANNEGERYFRLTEYFFDKRYFLDEHEIIQTEGGIFNRNLVLKEQLLVANDLPVEVQWAISHGNEEERKAALKKVRKLILSGRDFRYADFSEAILSRVDFVGADDKTADLSYANFQSALINDARMNAVELQGADLSGARLTGCRFKRGQTTGCRFKFGPTTGCRFKKR